MFKKLALISAISVAFAANACAALKDGEYTERVTGHNAPLTITVKVADGRIASITTKDLESPGVGKVAIAKLQNKSLIIRRWVLMAYQVPRLPACSSSVPSRSAWQRPGLI